MAPDNENYTNFVMEPETQFSLTKISIIKNLLVISLGFFLVFTASSALTNIQSSLHSEHGLGVISMSATYVGLLLSCIFLPPLVLQHVDCKWGISIPIISYALFTASNFYPTWYTMIPTALLTGLSGAIFWTAQGAYLTEISYQYSRIVGKSSDSVLTQFFGIFHVIYLFGHIAGNLASSLTFTPLVDVNATNLWNSSAQLKLCGSNFCNQPLGVEKYHINYVTVKNDAYEPNIDQVYILVGVCLSLDFLAFLLTIFFVTPLRKTHVHKVSGWKLVIATLRNLKNGKQLLLIPLNVLLGLQTAFLSSDFTQGFVTCSLGIHYIGYVMLCGGVVSVVVSLIVGTITNDFPRPPINVFAAIVQVSMCLMMLYYHPKPWLMLDVYFVMAGLWSLASATWLTQISALYGILFPKNAEAGFSNSQLWLAIGSIIGYAWSKYLCMSTKLFALIVFTFCSILCYLLVEILIIREKRSNTRRA